MPSAKKGKEAATWAISLLKLADEEREYDRKRAGSEEDLEARPPRDAVDLVKGVREEMNAEAETHHTPEFQDKFVCEWSKVLTDPAAMEAKGYVAQAFGDAIAHGPKGAWERLKGDHDKLALQAREYLEQAK